MFYTHRSILIVILLVVTHFGQSQPKIDYLHGISLEYELLQPQNETSEFEYFDGVNVSGYAFNFVFTNQLYFNKLFLSFDVGHSSSFEKQTFVFSNQIDPIIDFEHKNRIHHWLLNYGVGRDFQINDLNSLHLSVGFSTIGLYKRWKPGSDQSGKFESFFSNGDDPPGDNYLKQEYNYQISYAGYNFLSPFAKVGISFPLKSGELSFLLIGRLNRMFYQTRVKIDGGNYTAIAHLNYHAMSFGCSVTYKFAGQSKE